MSYTHPNKRKTKKTQSKTATIKILARKLSAAGEMNNINEGVSTDFICNEIINTYQCSVVNGKESKKEYSLLDSETDMETIKNENILDTSSYEKISNEAKSAEGRFSNKDDPFYNLDEALPNRLSSKRKESIQKSNVPDLVQLVVDLSKAK
tara:strand:- start:114 stop:566 length:453 start_codon:yes stop_codon:yes gene_type:complete